MEKSNNLAKNTILLSLGTFLTKGISFVMVPIFSRWLSTEDYGTFDLVCTYVTLLIPLVGLATETACFRFSMDAKTKDEQAKYISNCFAVFSMGLGIVVLASAALRIALRWELVLCFSVLLAGEGYNTYFCGYLRAIKRLDIYSFVNAISVVFIAIFTTLLIKGFGMGLQGIVLGYAFGYMSGDILVIIYTRFWDYLDLKTVSFAGIKELVSYSYALIPNNIAWWIINVSDRSIIRFFLGAASNGIYAIAYKIPNILSSVFSVFSISWQQSATEMVNSSERDRYYNEIYNKMIVVLISLCCGILSLNFCFFRFIFDVKYYDAYLYTPILIGGTFALTLSQFFGGIQISLKQPKENGITTVAGAVLNVFIHLALIKMVGLYAAAISTLLSQVIVCVLRNKRLKKNVVLKMTNRTMLLFSVYAYFSIVAYYIENTLFCVINVFCAAILVLAVNWPFIKSIVFSMIKRFR